MKVFRDLRRVPVFRTGTVVAVGNFDGLHAGHQKIIRRVIAIALKKNLFPLVLTFHPHPAGSLKGRAVPLIQTLAQRLDGLRQAGVKGTLVIPFDRAFSRLSGRAFAESVLAGALNARVVVVGGNFRFGTRRLCGIMDLARFGRKLGFGVEAVPPVILGGRAVSSSRIRRRLARGDVAGAARSLGTPYEITGRVVRGAGRGTSLGIPTANLLTENEILPPGVYLTKTSMSGRLCPSLTNIGTAPTFGRRHVQPEIHILGSRGPLYGRKLRVLFIQKLRNERKFASPATLVRRIGRDIEEARIFFGPG